MSFVRRYSSPETFAGGVAGLLADGTYLTDGTRLLQVVGWDVSGLVEVEDSATYEHWVVAAGDLIRAGVRRVVPAGS